MVSGDGSGDYQTGAVGDLKTLEHLTSWQPQYRIGPSAFKHAWWDFKQVSLIDANANGLGKFQPQRRAGAGGLRVSGPPRGGRRGQAHGQEPHGGAGGAGPVGVRRVRPLPARDRVEVQGPDHNVDLPGGGEVSEFVAVRVEHRARDVSQMPFEGSVSYQNDFVAIPGDASYRPPRVTPRPFITGPQTATVTDTPDEFGRCKVKFHWEEETSRWTRVAQNWAYNTMGTQWFPRIDTEVIVDFLNGDPDHPIVVGQVYNGNNKPPFDVPGNKTQSGFRGANWGSAGTADVSNELRFEDKSGSEEIYIHAQKDFRRVSPMTTSSTSRRATGPSPSTRAPSNRRCRWATTS